MNDPLGGLNPHHAVAGFGGALAALPFLKPATLLMASGMLVAGLATAMYMTPAVSEFMHSSGIINAPLTGRSELGLAFLVGLTAMISIPTTLEAVTWIKTNIARIMERVTGVRKEGGDDEPR